MFWLIRVLAMTLLRFPLILKVRFRLLWDGGLDTLVINGDVGAFSWSAGVGANRDDIVLTSADASIVLADQMAYDENLVFSYIEFVTTDPVTGQETSEIFQIDPNAPQVEGAIVTFWALIEMMS